MALTPDIQQDLSLRIDALDKRPSLLNFPLIETLGMIEEAQRIADIVNSRTLVLFDLCNAGRVEAPRALAEVRLGPVVGAICQSFKHVLLGRGDNMPSVAGGTNINR